MQQIADFLEQILKDKYLCDNCLGRQFASLLTGYTNKQRGQAIRMYLAFLAEADQIKIKSSNFYGMQFRLKKMKGEKEKCYLCDNIFSKIDEKAKKIAKKIQSYEFNTFLLGTNPPNEIMKKETEFWEEYGIEWAESINTEINREMGKIISKLMEKELDRKSPEITILYDFNKK
ncbi:MAG: THUMP domain-containing protein, partial [Candidatus Aenigmatarchaeota archaeon]